MIQLNINGAGSSDTKQKYYNLIHWMNENHIDVACLSEAHSPNTGYIQDIIN